MLRATPLGVLMQVVAVAWLSACESGNVSPPEPSDGKSSKTKGSKNSDSSDSCLTDDCDEGDDDSETPDDTSASDTSTATGGDANGVSPDSPIDKSNTFVHSPEKEACHAKGQMFLRQISITNLKGSCSDKGTYPPSYDCSRDGIVKALNNDKLLTDAIDSKLASNYFIDDCGEKDGRPVVFLSCLHTGNKVCMDPPAEVKFTATTTVNVTMIGVD